MILPMQYKHIHSFNERDFNYPLNISAEDLQEMQMHFTVS